MCDALSSAPKKERLGIFLGGKGWKWKEEKRARCRKERESALKAAPDLVVFSRKKWRKSFSSWEGKVTELEKSLTTIGIVARQPNNFPERGCAQFFWVKDGPTWRIPPKKKNGGRRK